MNQKRQILASLALPKMSRCTEPIYPKKELLEPKFFLPHQEHHKILRRAEAEPKKMTKDEE